MLITVPEKHSKSQLVAMLTFKQFPRSAKYDPEWVIENLMGPMCYG